MNVSLLLHATDDDRRFRLTRPSHGFEDGERQDLCTISAALASLFAHDGIVVRQPHAANHVDRSGVVICGCDEPGVVLLDLRTDVSDRETTIEHIRMPSRAVDSLLDRSSPGRIGWCHKSLPEEQEQAA